MPEDYGSNSAQSSPFTINYLSGQVSGEVATDTVRLAQYEISCQIFGLCGLRLFAFLKGTKGLLLSSLGR